MLRPEKMPDKMNKARDYRIDSDECLHLARQGDRIERCDMLTRMAEASISLTDYRERRTDPQRVPAALSSFVSQEQRSSRFR
jgi:hypothetical protein